MGAIAAFMLKWGRIIVGYGLLVAAVALLIHAIGNVVGLDIQPPWIYVQRIDAALGRAADALLDMVQQDGDNGGFGALMLWAVAFDAMVEGMILVLDTVQVGLAWLASISTGAIGCLALRWLMIRGIIRANMFSGTKVGM